MYRMSVVKKGDVRFCINGLEVFCFVDDGETYGPTLAGGKLGFRQLAPCVAEYANLRVYGI